MSPIRLVGVAVVVLLVSGTPASAKDLGSKLKDRQAKLSHARDRAGVLTTTISHYRGRIEGLSEEITALRRREAEVKQRLDAKQAELDEAVAELDLAKKHLEVVRARLKRALVTLRERLIAIYGTGTPDTLSVIVGADGYDELIDRAEFLERIHAMDEAVISRVRQLRDEVQSTVRGLRTAKLRIEAARAAIGPAGASRRADPLWLRPPDLAGRRPGRLRLRDAVGAHAHRNRHRRPRRTAIRAADAGTVALVQSESESGGYGNFTCIDHGGGLETCYAHQSSVAVSAGQTVSQGQVIGSTGCTGHCFGPHLHFEVRVGGVPTDPLGYL
jgi:septal ring factor EnvC (AmiA/AmiB activator)